MTAINNDNDQDNKSQNSNTQNADQAQQSTISNQVVVQEDVRNYYRLNNVIGVFAYKIPTLPALNDYTDAYDSRLQVPPILSLLNQSREAHIDNNNLLKQIRSKNSNVGRYLERLNDRLDLLQKAILYIDQSFPSFSWQWLHYSEAGVDFLVPHTTSQYPNPLSPKTELAIGDQLHLILGIPASDEEIAETSAIMPPEHKVYQPHYSPSGYISVIGIITSIEDETAAVRIGCSFDKITDFDRQFLARHILAVQSFRRRQTLDQEH